MNKVVNLLQQYISEGQLEKALVECKKFVQANPSEIYPLKLLAHIYFLQEEYQKAIDTALKVLEKSANDFDGNNNLGSYYLKLEEFKKALFYIEKAKQINPDHPAPYQNHSETLMKMRDFKGAAKHIDKCISQHETYSNDYITYKSTLLIRVEIYTALKEQSEAIKFLKKYLSIKFDAELLLHLIQIDRNEASDEMINICKQKILNKTFGSKMERYQEQVPLYFSLAVFYEKTDPPTSDKYYTKANDEVTEIQRLTMIKFQRAVLKIIENYEMVKNFNPKNHNKGKDNIFILGMPRSGTTLTESIITANTEVFGGGELMSFYDLAYRLLIDKKYDEKSFEMVGEQYIERTKFLLTNQNKIADKLPNNYAFIGHIRKFLPGAKIVLVLRNPWDLAVSLYKQRYVMNISFSSSFFNLGVQMANFEASLLYWKKMDMLDENVMIIKYEELVKNFDESQEKLYDFCEISSKYESEKRESFFAKTASINQVQNKIHTESLKKSNFSGLDTEFQEAFYSQREFWKSKNIFEIPADFFGYNV
tara:strand:+ start:1523 stop:3127 length:1605 start_codon:yes stop_codon:yes gene_type:complete